MRQRGFLDTQPMHEGLTAAHNHPHDPGIVFNRHFDVEGEVVFRQACPLGCEGIVSKRLGSPYRSGRADCWVKVKNPARASRQARG